MNNESGIIETTEVPLGAGLTYEKMISTYFDSGALMVQPETVYRLNGYKGDRYYYTFEPDGEVIFYTSVTTLIKQTMPTPYSLIKWIAEKGLEEAEAFKEERADYGTFMHIEISNLLIARKLDLDSMKERLRDYIEANDLPVDFIYHLDEIKKDLLAFAQFVIDHNVRPLAIEIVLADRENGFAGALDLVCKMEIEEKGFWGEVYASGPQKGRPKETKQFVEITAIIDFKSGRKGFFESHEIQLEAYKTMWNKQFPGVPVTRIFNWSPKDWRTAPSYNLKDQTESLNLRKLPHLVELAKIERRKATNQVLICQGEIELDKRDLTENLMNVQLSDLIKEKKAEQLAKSDER